MSPIVQIQRRMMQLGRVRLGEKGPRGEPRKLATFRFTSASRPLLDAVSSLYGGRVSAWEGAPDEGYFQVTTEATSLDIILPPVFSDVDGTPTLPYSQWYERWSAGGCERRCDGVTESLSGKPCLCDPDRRKQGEKTECQVTTRVSFMLPDVPGLGVWRLDSKGWNAATELPLTLEVLSSAAREHKFIPATLSVQKRTSKQAGQTRRYVVPVIELKDATVRQLAAGEVPSLLAVNAPAAAPARPAILSGALLPEDTSFEDERRPDFGERPALPTGAADDGGGTEGQGLPPGSDAAADDAVAAASEVASSPAAQQAAGGDAAASPSAVPGATAAQKKKLDRLVASLSEAGRIKIAHLWGALAASRDLESQVMVEILGCSGDNGIAWEPLRDSLTKAEAEDLVGRLQRLEQNAGGPGPFAEAARAAGVQQ